MGWIDRISEYLEPSSCMHAVGQGALGKMFLFIFNLNNVQKLIIIIIIDFMLIGKRLIGNILYFLSFIIIILSSYFFYSLVKGIAYKMPLYSETLNNEYIERIHQMSYSSLSDNGML